MPSDAQHNADHNLLGLNPTKAHSRAEYELARNNKIQDAFGRYGNKHDNPLYLAEREQLHDACKRCNALPNLGQGTKSAQDNAAQNQGKGVNPSIQSAGEDWKQYLSEFEERSRHSQVQDNSAMRVLIKVLAGLLFKDGGYRTSIPARWQGADPATTDCLQIDNADERVIVQDFVDDFNKINGPNAVRISEEEDGKMVLQYDTPDRAAEFREFMDANYTIDPKRADEFEAAINNFNQAKGAELVTFDKADNKFDLKFAGGDKVAQQQVRGEFKDWVHDNAKGLGPDAAPAPANP